MKIIIGAVVLATILTAALWASGLIGGETVLGTKWLNGRTDASAGDQVIIVIGQGGVTAGLMPGAEITIGSLDTGAAYCKAKIVETMATPDGPGYAAKCF